MEMACSNLLISPQHMTWGWTFYFAPFNHLNFGVNMFFSFQLFFISNQLKIFSLLTLVYFLVSGNDLVVCPQNLYEKLDKPC